jgi:hypothetical protein
MEAMTEMAIGVKRHERAMPDWLACISLLALAGIVGCASQRRVPADTRIESPYPAHQTFAIAPALNLSNDPEIDTLAVSDLIYSELQQIKGVTVIPNNRVLSEMAGAGITEVRSVKEIEQLSSALGVDGVILLGVTEYRPYSPPVVGVVCHMYAVQNGLSTGNDRPQSRPTAEVARVYNAGHEPTQRDVREYAEFRSHNGSPFGWRVYLEDQRLYLRFVCHQVVRDLLRADFQRGYLDQIDQEVGS